MPVSPVVNASPLIYLSRGGLLDLLLLLNSEILVPDPVAKELRQRGPDDPAAKALEQTSWLRIALTPPVPPVIQAWDLGAGESAVLSYAVANPGTIAVIDDLAGRRCAEALGIPVNGTIGLVLIAKRRGVVPAARPVLDGLRQAGMYLSDRVMNRALAMVGE